MKDVFARITTFGLIEYTREFGGILRLEIQEQLITSIWNVRDLRLLVEHHVSYKGIRSTLLCSVLRPLPHGTPWPETQKSTLGGSRPPQRDTKNSSCMDAAQRPVRKPNPALKSHFISGERDAEPWTGARRCVYIYIYIAVSANNTEWQ